MFRIFMILMFAFLVSHSVPVWADEGDTQNEKTTISASESLDMEKAEEKKAAKKKSSPYELPAYKDTDIRIMGRMVEHSVGEQDTLHDIARHYDVGFIEIRAANPGMDSWAPDPGRQVLIPSWHILPRAAQDGIVVNLAEMRLYYFKEKGKDPETHPLGIGRDGLETPLGITKIVRKTEGPNWYPTERMREESPDLPWKVEPGPANPLGTHALYLGWPTFLIHGTNKPWGIGRAVSSGCIRMYPEDIIRMYENTPLETKVSVVDQPVKLAIIADTLYLEFSVTGKEMQDVEINGYFTPVTRDVPEKLRTLIEKEVENTGIEVDWEAVEDAFLQKTGYPVAVGRKVDNTPETDGRTARPDYSYN